MELEEACKNTGDCIEYRSYFQEKRSQADLETANSNQFIFTLGLIVAFIGLFVLLTPFIKPIQRIQRFILSKLFIASPIIFGIIAGAFVGFLISFSACFKKECSLIASSAMFTIPAACLIITIPESIKIYKSRKDIEEKINQVKLITWIIIGALIILFAFFKTVALIRDNYSFNESEKKYINSLERY